MSKLTVTGLPPREGQALELTAQGLTTKLAARQMHCSPRNVEALLHICMGRLGACNRTHLITRAVEQGFLRVGMLALIVSTLFSLAPTPAAADDDQIMLRRGRSRMQGRRCAALPELSDIDSIDLSLAHVLVWDDGLFVVYP